MQITIGNMVEVRLRKYRIGALDEAQPGKEIKTGDDEWLPAMVKRIHKDGTIDVLVNQPGHKFHEATLTADSEHWRTPAKK
jgi:hypothetical protein